MKKNNLTKLKEEFLQFGGKESFTRFSILQIIEKHEKQFDCEELTFDQFKEVFDKVKVEEKLNTNELNKWLKSDSVYTALRRAVKSPSSTGVDDCEDNDYIDLYNLVCELRKSNN